MNQYIKISISVKLDALFIEEFAKIARIRSKLN